MKKIIVLPLFALLLVSCGEGNHFKPESYQTNFDYKEDYTICVLNDCHFNYLSDMNREIKYLNSVIYSKAKLEHPDWVINTMVVDDKVKEFGPDLIILNGDTFMDANKYVAKRIINYLDSLDIPFGFTYGNHDSEGSYGRNYLQSLFNKCENSLNIDLVDDVYGDTNFTVNLMDGNIVKWQIIAMDSNSYSLIGYDGFHQDQVAWYEEQVKSSNYAPSILFAHIPIAEFEDAWIKASLEASGGKETHMISPGKDYKGKSTWWMMESVSSAPRQDSLYEKIEELGTRTKGMVVAHDHINNTDFHYDPEGDGSEIRFIFGTKTTDNIYHDVRMMGCSFYSLNSDETFDILRVNVNYKGDTFVMSDKYINSQGGER